MTNQRPAQIADELLARLPASPDVYPQKLDLVRDAVLLVRFDAASYRAASFLDDRILSPTTQGAWVPFSAISDAARRVALRRPVHFIFHTGHVGSTLISRLLEEADGVLSLREPLPLRTLAEVHDGLGRYDSLLSESSFDTAMGAFMGLWSRGYDATRNVVVKATSSAGRIASAILRRSDNSRALYLNLRAEPYLATLLAGQNSPIDLRGHGQERIRRLSSRLSEAPGALNAMSTGEMAAMSWLTETWAQRDAAVDFGQRVLSLDFEAFLGDVAAAMGRIVAHLGMDVDARYLSQVQRSAVLTRYSKAPEFSYTPAVRAEVLRDSRRDNRDEIRKGMEWLERVAASEPSARAIVDEA